MTTPRRPTPTRAHVTMVTCAGYRIAAGRRVERMLCGKRERDLAEHGTPCASRYTGRTVGTVNACIPSILNRRQADAWCAPPEGGDRRRSPDETR